MLVNHNNMLLSIFINVLLLVYHINKQHSLTHGRGTNSSSSDWFQLHFVTPVQYWQYQHYHWWYINSFSITCKVALNFSFLPWSSNSDGCSPLLNTDKTLYFTPPRRRYVLWNRDSAPIFIITLLLPCDMISLVKSTQTCLQSMFVSTAGKQ